LRYFIVVKLVLNVESETVLALALAAKLAPGRSAARSPAKSALIAKTLVALFLILDPALSAPPEDAALLFNTVGIPTM
jgi:hypothetical protein